MQFSLVLLKCMPSSLLFINMVVSPCIVNWENKGFDVTPKLCLMKKNTYSLFSGSSHNEPLSQTKFELSFFRTAHRSILVECWIVGPIENRGLIFLSYYIFKGIQIKNYNYVFRSFFDYWTGILSVLCGMNHF